MNFSEVANTTDRIYGNIRFLYSFLMRKYHDILGISIIKDGPSSKLVSLTVKAYGSFTLFAGFHMCRPE